MAALIVSGSDKREEIAPREEGGGSVTIHVKSLRVGDGAAVSEEMSLTISTGEDSEIMLYDLS